MALDFLDPAYYGISVGQAETAIPVIYDASYSFEMLKIQKATFCEISSEDLMRYPSNDLKYGSRTHIYRYITDEGHFW